MEVQVLGAHSSEAGELRMSSILIDGVLALDAGGLTASLTLPEQQKVKTVLLTHHHFDHTRDLVTLGANGALFGGQVDIYGLQHTLDMVNFCLLDGKMHADFSKLPSETKPFLRMKALEAGRSLKIHGYDVLPVTIRHAVPAVGYQISRNGTPALFYTGDTGPDMADCWQHISPQLLLIEVSGLNSAQDFLKSVGHLSARLLKEELVKFRQAKGYLPHVVVIHIPPQSQVEVKREVEEAGQELGLRIDTGYEGMRITL